VTAQSGSVTEAAARLADGLVSGEIPSREVLEKAKKEIAREHSLSRYISNSEILMAMPVASRAAFQEMLRVHPRRSASGIVVVTAFSAPFSCPHGTCVFCPGGPKDGTPQSYMPDSPGMKTALASGFDPHQQVRKSLSKYAANGHATDKVEAIIEGGTFIALPPDYQLSFVKGVYDGLNGTSSQSLEAAQTANESASSRCVGLTLETKPDWCRKEHVDLMLTYGITRVEIGVQSLYDHTLKQSNRGHTVEDTQAAFRVARDAGLKVTAHMMPGLPGSTPQDDLADLRRLFEDESFRPDMLKVYPTLVVPGTALERQFASGKYVPYQLETVVELLSEMKRFVPRWHRIMRIQKEIPAHEIAAGVRAGNLRELVLARARDKGFQCQCIRCREVALAGPSAADGGDELELRSETYTASGGTDVFCSVEGRTNGRVAGFVRMRLPSDSAERPEVKDSAIIRELRVYGRLVGIGDRRGNAWQHRGLGSKLLGEMERRAREDFGVRRILVTSAVGTRIYYRRSGYVRDGPYMAKSLPGPSLR
jgi:elongator complex protein 3